MPDGTTDAELTTKPVVMTLNIHPALFHKIVEIHRVRNAGESYEETAMIVLARGADMLIQKIGVATQERHVATPSSESTDETPKDKPPAPKDPPPPGTFASDDEPEARPPKKGGR